MGNFLTANLAEPPVFFSRRFPRSDFRCSYRDLQWCALDFYVASLPQLSCFYMGENRGRRTQICLTEVKRIMGTAMCGDSFPVVWSGERWLLSEPIYEMTCSHPKRMSAHSIVFWGLNCNNQLLGCYLRIPISFSKEDALSVIPFPGNIKTNWFMGPIASCSWDGLLPHSWECALWPVLASRGGSITKAQSQVSFPPAESESTLTKILGD